MIVKKEGKTDKNLNVLNFQNQEFKRSDIKNLKTEEI